MSEELGTRKYNIMINKKYLVRFDEIDDKTGMGSYTNGVLVGFSAIPATDIMITSENKREAMIIDGKFNLKSIMTKILSDINYKFYNIEIIELGEEIEIENGGKHDTYMQ